jgi:hypothetical protein
MTNRNVFVSASSAPGACRSAASMVGTLENVTGSKRATVSQKVDAEKRSHMATCAPRSIGMTVVTICALTWNSGRTIPMMSPRPTGTSSPSIRVFAMKLPWESIAPLGGPWSRRCR